MGLFKRKAGQEAEGGIGSGLAAVLPPDSRPWYRVLHLLRLNLILLIPLLSSSAIGYDGSMMNGLQTLPQWREAFDNPEGAILGLMNAIYPVGKIIALALVTYLSDRFGRKRTIIIGAVTCVAIPFVQATSKNIPTFIASRALLGFFTSFMSQPSPIIITELAYPTHRGKLTALYNTSFYLGGIIAAWCTYSTFKFQSDWSWRLPSMLQALIPAIQALCLYFLPESPRWLVAHGRIAEAREILVKHHAGGDESSPLVDFELAEIETALSMEADISQTSWLELFRTPANRKRTLIAFIVGWFTQWNGVGLISYYLFLILNTIGITGAKDQTLINGLLNVSNWIAAVFVGALMVDRLGRRTLYLLSTGGMLVFYIIWTALTAHFVQSKDQATGKAVVAFVFITYFCYAIAWVPLLQAYPVEIFPYTLRGRGLSFVYYSSFSGLVVANQVNPIAMQKLGWKYYIVFICVLSFLLVVIYFLFPETKGHTLEEIREVFEGDQKLNDIGRLASVEDAQTKNKETKRSETADHVETS
ncbi:general substrate transporter [Dactylonectria macrodidyma]|uniref:General substrate transporter n=1 Tax=Dactylonectria macrodidyma TaxID=307937 RepID=A0A9P9EQQ3_9HYPO|nr:general substrate transporter [Dactylonectria macrodidyma]